MSLTPALVAPPTRRTVGGRLDAMLDELEQVRRADRTAASDEDRLAWIERIRTVQRRVDALAAILIGEADEAGSAMRARHSHLQDWLARSGQESPRQATAALWAARELERRPEVRDAAADGRISLTQAKAINVALDGLPSGLDGSQRHRAEQLMLAAATHTPPDVLRSMSEKVLAQVSPERSETPEQRAERLTQRDLRASARRFLRFGPEEDGSMALSASLPVLDARRLQHLVQTVADRNYRAAKDSRNRAVLLETPQQRLADALMVVAEAAEGGEAQQDHGGKSSIPPAATRISVVMTAEDLLDRATTHGMLADGTELSPGELRRLLCGAELLPVVLATDSTILDIGYTHRLAPWPLRHAIGLRDGGCAFPGCGAPLEHCDIHHIKPWQEGGPTSPSNLVALCRSHHGLVEPVPPIRLDDGRLEPADQWEVHIDGRGLPVFVPPKALDPHRTPLARSTSHVQALLDTG